MMTPNTFVLLIASVAGTAPESGGEIDPRGREIAESYKDRVCAMALDAVSLEVEKRYQAALIGPARGERRIAQLNESHAARQSLISRKPYGCGRR